MTTKIIASTWWVPPILPLGAIQGTCIGAVAIRLPDGQWKAYIGYGNGMDQYADELTIMVHGSKLTSSQAFGLFPDLPQKEFTL